MNARKKGDIRRAIKLAQQLFGTVKIELSQEPEGQGSRITIVTLLEVLTLFCPKHLKYITVHSILIAITQQGSYFYHTHFTGEENWGTENLSHVCPESHGLSGAEPDLDPGSMVSEFLTTRKNSLCFKN